MLLWESRLSGVVASFVTSLGYDTMNALCIIPRHTARKKGPWLGWKYEGGWYCLCVYAVAVAVKYVVGSRGCRRIERLRPAARRRV